MFTDAILSRLEGGILFAGIVGYLIWQVMCARKERRANKSDAMELNDDMPESTSDTKKIILFIVIGIIGLPIGAHLTVEGAEEIAESFGVSDAIIGVTIVAIGTSLPELVTSVMAAIRRSGGVALGNVVGSNIFNVGLIMGTTGLIYPLAVDPHLLTVDVPMMVLASLLLVLLAYFSKPINRLGGLLMMGVYTAYIVLAF